MTNNVTFPVSITYTVGGAHKCDYEHVTIELDGGEVDNMLYDMILANRKLTDVVVTDLESGHTFRPKRTY